MKYKATVLHQVGPGMFFGINEGSEFFHAHDFDIEADGHMQAAELVFEITNLGPEEVSARKALLYGDQMRSYRQRMNRSTSVSDLLILRDASDGSLLAVLACATSGWQPLTAMPDYEHGVNSTVESQSYQAHQKLMEAQRG